MFAPFCLPKIQIFETYLDQAHTAQRIIFTKTRERNGLHGLLVWFVAKHKHVSKCIDLIHSSNGRLNPKKRPASARSLFAQANNEEKLLDDHIVLLNPAANTPLKIYNADIRMLGSEESLANLRCASRLTKRLLSLCLAQCWCWADRYATYGTWV